MSQQLVNHHKRSVIICEARKPYTTNYLYHQMVASTERNILTKIGNCLHETSTYIAANTLT